MARRRRVRRWVVGAGLVLGRGVAGAGGGAQAEAVDSGGAGGRRMMFGSRYRDAVGTGARGVWERRLSRGLTAEQRLFLLGDTALSGPGRAQAGVVAEPAGRTGVLCGLPGCTGAWRPGIAGGHCWRWRSGSIPSNGHFPVAGGGRASDGSSGRDGRRPPCLQPRAARLGDPRRGGAGEAVGLFRRRRGMPRCESYQGR